MIQIKKISESKKKNKSINETYLVCYCSKKKHNFYVANFEL